MSEKDCKTCKDGYAELRWFGARVDTTQSQGVRRKDRNGDLYWDTEAVWRCQFECPECSRRITKYLRDV